MAETAAEPTLVTNDRKQTDDQRAFRREQIKLLFGQLNLIYLADALAGSFLFLLLISSSASTIGYIWYSILLVSTVIRAIIAKNHKLEVLSDTSQKKNWVFLVTGAIWSGLIWGFAWTLLPPNRSFLELAAIGLWLAGMLAGAATTMCVIKEVFLGFAIPAAIIFLSYNLLSNTEDSLILAGGFLMYLGVITPIAVRIGNDFNRTIILQTKNNALKADLLIEANRLQIKEAELEKQKIKSQALEDQSRLADEK